LVLVRRATSLHSPSAIAKWLYGVACRTALEAKSAAARRRTREMAVLSQAALPQTAMPENPWAGLWPGRSEQVGRRAEEDRTPVVLCDLEGRPRKEAARQLGWPEGTVASRVARGRSMLAKRLARRGFAGALAGTALANGAAAACVPTPLVVATVRAAGLSGAA